MLRYNYEYKKESNGFTSICVYAQNIVMILLDPSDPDHNKMIISFDNNIECLEVYVNYLGDNPNRNFNIDEIDNLYE